MDALGVAVTFFGVITLYIVIHTFQSYTKREQKFMERDDIILNVLIGKSIDKPVAVEASYKAVESKVDKIKNQLTDREMEILKSLCDGKTNKQIAKEFNLSSDTIAKHIQNIRGKFGAGNRESVISYALRSGMVE